jgi:hypothetical protein
MYASVSTYKRYGAGDKYRYEQISLFHRAFQFTIYKGSTNALVCNKTLIQMPHIKTPKITTNIFLSSDDHHQGAFDPS